MTAAVTILAIGLVGTTFSVACQVSVLYLRRQGERHRALVDDSLRLLDQLRRSAR